MTGFAVLPQADKTAMKFYRFQDGWADSGEASEFVWYMVRETPKGYWITDEWKLQEKFVLKDGKKRFAYPSRELAFESYTKRKEKQVKILTHQLANAVKRLAYAKAKGAPVPEPLPDQSGDFNF